MKRLFLSILALLLVAIVMAMWGWTRATALPDWYQPNGEADVGVSGKGLGREGATLKIVHEILQDVAAEEENDSGSRLEQLKRQGRALFEGLTEGREIELQETELELLLVGQLAGTQRGRQLLAAAKVVHAFIEDGEIEVGAVFNLSEIPQEVQDSRLWIKAQKVATIWPPLADKNLYVAIRGRPDARYGNLYFERGTKLKIGKLVLPFVTTIRLIVPEGDHFEDGLEIDLGRFDLKQIEVLEDSVKMTVVARI